jgi:hypothetical protein
MRIILLNIRYKPEAKRKTESKTFGTNGKTRGGSHHPKRPLQSKTKNQSSKTPNNQIRNNNTPLNLNTQPTNTRSH